jgi:WD40 repeat protein/tetratricopeptide (TPR) repeat protein
VFAERTTDHLPDPAAPAGAVGSSSSAGARFVILRPHAAGGLGQVSVVLDGGKAFAEFSPDGRFLLLGTYRETADLFGGLLGKPEPRLDLHRIDLASGQVMTARWRRKYQHYAHAGFSPDGKRFVVGVWWLNAALQPRGEAAVWDAAALEPAGPPLEHEDRVDQVAFSPDGRQVLTSGGLQVCIWDAATGKAVTPPLRHGALVEHAEFAPWGKPVRTAGSGKPWKAPAELTPEGRQVRTVVAGSLHVWDAATGTLLATRQTPGSTSAGLGFSPDGRALLTADLENQIGKSGRGTMPRLWDAEKGSPLTPYFRHAGRVTHARFAPDGRRVVTVGSRPFVPGVETRLWDAAIARPERPVDVGGQWFANGWVSPDARRVLVQRTTAPNHILDLATRRFVPLQEMERFAINMADFSADGRRLVTVSTSPLEAEALIRVWDAATSKPVSPVIDLAVEAADLSVHDSGVRVCFSRDGRWIAALVEKRPPAGTTRYEVRAWDAASGQPQGRPVTVEGKSWGGAPSLTFVPGGLKLILVAHGKAYLVDLPAGKAEEKSTGKVVNMPMRWPSHVWTMPQPVDFSPDERLLVLAAASDRAQVYETATFRPVGAPLAHRNAVDHVAFSPDGRKVVTASADHTARVWDARTGEPLSAPLAHADALRRAAFSPDGRLVATAAQDGTVRVWDAATGEPVTPFLPLAATRLAGTESEERAYGKEFGGFAVAEWPHTLLFAPDGRRLLAAPFHMADLTVWDLSPDGRPAEDLVRLARVVAGQKLDAQGNMVAIDAEELRREWRALREKYPTDFTLAPADVAAWHHREAAECIVADERPAAVFHLDRLILAAPKMPLLYNVRAEVLAEMGDWDRAAAGLATAVTLPDAPAETWERLARVRLAAGDVGEYRRVCAAMLRRFGKADQGDVANSVAWTCVLAPGALPDLEPAVALAEMARALNRREANLLNTLGCILYRAGKYEEAVHRLEESIRLHGGGGVPADWLFLAMAHHRLGHGDQAKQCLARGTALIKAAQEEKPRFAAHLYRLSWAQRQEMLLFRREAEAVLADPPGKE